MAISVISKITQKNKGVYKLMDSKNVSYDGSEEISVKDILDKLSTKVIYFVLKDAIKGTNGLECQFPYNGVITEVSAIYSSETKEDILIDIEKTNEQDRLDNKWNTILSNNLAVNNTTKKQEYEIIDNIVNEKDVFRINILNNLDISSLTVNIKIII